MNVSETIRRENIAVQWERLYRNIAIFIAIIMAFAIAMAIFAILKDNTDSKTIPGLAAFFLLTVASTAIGSWLMWIRGLRRLPRKIKLDGEDIVLEYAGESSRAPMRQFRYRIGESREDHDFGPYLPNRKCVIVTLHHGCQVACGALDDSCEEWAQQLREGGCRKS